MKYYAREGLQDKIFEMLMNCVKESYRHGMKLISALSTSLFSSGVSVFAHVLMLMEDT